MNLEDSEARTLYWALEKLETEFSLNKDEKALFQEVADQVDQPTGIEDRENRQMNRYYAVINDAAGFHEPEPVVFARDGPHTAIYQDQDEALKQRDQLRERHDNPDLNVHTIEIHEAIGE